MIWQNLQSGISQVLAHKRMIVVFFLANLFFGFLIILPLRAMLKNFIGDSTLGAALGGNLDMDFLFDFFQHNDQAMPTLWAMIFLVPLVNWLFTLFLSGGALSIFAAGEGYTPASFWGNAAKYFGRFLRLALWSLPALALLFCLQFLASGFERVIFGKGPYQNIVYWNGWIKVGLRAIGFLLFGMILDYARIYTVRTDERRMLNALKQGIKFVWGNFLQTFGLALLLLAIGVVALLIYNPLANSLSAPNALIVFMLFAVQQIYMIFRMIIRLTTYSSQLHLYRELAASPVTMPATEALDISGLTPATE